ncbi:MAG: hypothetical protein HY226_03635 [Candidatus Vogelbacteria bacterium]|nr:hypothetical protein [Candidatus Vogelbacteria bacterium]
MTKIKKMPENNIDNAVDPGAGHKNRKRRGPHFEETTDTKEIPHFGVERLDNVGTGPDDTGGRGGPDDI